MKSCIIYKSMVLTQIVIKKSKSAGTCEISADMVYLHFVLCCMCWYGVNGDFIGQPEAADTTIVHPVKITADGGFVSHFLSHRVRRDLRPLDSDGQVYYRVNYKGRLLSFRLAENDHLVSSDYILETRNGSTVRAETRHPRNHSCHLLGTVEAAGVRGTAAISTCKGLVRSVSLNMSVKLKYIIGQY